MPFPPLPVILHFLCVCLPAGCQLWVEDLDVNHSLSPLTLPRPISFLLASHSSLVQSAPRVSGPCPGHEGCSLGDDGDGDDGDKMKKEGGRTSMGMGREEEERRGQLTFVESLLHPNHWHMFSQSVLLELGYMHILVFIVQMKKPRAREASVHGD